MKITHIDPLLRAIEGKPEFVVLDKGDFTVIDYVYQDQHTFDDPLTMECRGIKFDQDGLILARPFRKFFNYGERGSGLPIQRPHVITEKLDGSMVHPVFLDRKLFLMTRKGHTDVAKRAERHLMSTSEIRYANFCHTSVQQGWTPIFEYTGPDNRIVLRYDEAALTLLALRHTIDGTIMSYSLAAGYAQSFGVPVAKNHGDMSVFLGPDEFVEHTRKLQGAEGYVVYFDDGYMVKIKAEEYVIQHRALDDLSSKKKVMTLVCQGFADDVLPILSEADASELIAFNDEVQTEVTKLSMVAEGMASVWKQERKVFALDFAPEMKPIWLAGVVFGVMDGKPARPMVLKAIMKDPDCLEIKWRGV